MLLELGRGYIFGFRNGRRWDIWVRGRRLVQRRHVAHMKREIQIWYSPSIDRAIRIASDFGCRRTQLTIALQTANVSEILSWVFLICFWYNARNLGLKELSMCRFGVRRWNFKLIISLTPHKHARFVPSSIEVSKYPNIWPSKYLSIWVTWEWLGRQRVTDIILL